MTKLANSLSAHKSSPVLSVAWLVLPPILFLIVVFGYRHISQVRKESEYVSGLRRAGIDPVDVRGEFGEFSWGYVTVLYFPEERKVDDELLGEISVLRYLNTLDLSGTRITDRALVKLEKLNYLNELNLSRTGITDVGVESIVHLPRLRKLDISHTKVSQGKFLELKRKLPDIEIIWY